jgi:hypothetical protein
MRGEGVEAEGRNAMECRALGAHPSLLHPPPHSSVLLRLSQSADTTSARSVRTTVVGGTVAVLCWACLYACGGWGGLASRAC